MSEANETNGQDEAGEEIVRLPVNSEVFEKMINLIETLEYEQALIDLKALMSFAYDDEIDERLSELLKTLQRKHYVDAREKARSLRSLVRHIARETRQEKAKRKILAVDDFPDILRRLKTGLKDNFDVVGVTNHMMALKYLTTNTPDLIILDVEMPDMDGYTLLGIIRKLEGYKNTPVIFLTSNATPDLVKTAFEQGGNDYLKKPVDLNLLTERILKLLPNE